MERRALSMEQLGPLLEEQLGLGRATLVVTGSSMLPMLHHGRDMVSLVPLDGPPEWGDVIFYRRPSGQYVLHRVVHKGGTSGCTCSGDNQWQPEFVAQTCVLARVERFRRNGKEIICKESKAYRLYTIIWTGMFPVRRPIIGLRRLLGRLRRKIRRNRP